MCGCGTGASIFTIMQSAYLDQQFREMQQPSAWPPAIRTISICFKTWNKEFFCCCTKCIKSAVTADKRNEQHLASLLKWRPGEGWLLADNLMAHWDQNHVVFLSGKLEQSNSNGTRLEKPVVKVNYWAEMKMAGRGNKTGSPTSDRTSSCGPL
jgi:hypothetical protein